LKELHIPYGIERDTSKIIEPEDAIRGRACNCICPGCGAPLLSRHPQADDKRIHFAHDSKHADAKPIEECPLSPFVALGMMLRHITGVLPGKSIKLSAHGKSIDFSCCSTPARFISIADSCEGIISNSSAAPTLGGVTFDLVLTIDEMPYFVEIIYPGKPKKDLPASNYLDGIGGILTISGPEFMEMMGKEEGDHLNLRYSDAVVYFLLQYSRKFWSYHANEKMVEAEVRSAHICKPNYKTKSYRQNNWTGAQNNNSGSYTPKYTTYCNSPLHRDSQEGVQRPKSTQELADEYLKGSRGDSGFSRNLGRNPVPRITPTFEESNYLLRDNNFPSSHGAHVQQSEDKYECVFCTVTFVVNNQTIPSCPKCKSHLGSRRI